MTVIKFPSLKNKESVMQNINDLICNTQAETQKIEDYIENAPYLLQSFSVLRNMLRAAKRSGNLNKSINSYAAECCPPYKRQEVDSDYCQTTSCEECWLNYIEAYDESEKEN